MKITFKREPNNDEVKQELYCNEIVFADGFVVVWVIYHKLPQFMIDFFARNNITVHTWFAEQSMRLFIPFGKIEHISQEAREDVYYVPDKY